MILIHRPAPPQAFLEYPLRIHQLKEMRSWFSRPLIERINLQFPHRWTDAPEIAQILRQVFANKCAFCEVRLEQERDELLLAHFRPPEGAIQEKHGSADPDHYWWLSWEWSNLYLVCPICIRAKGQIFPTAKSRATPNTYSKGLQKEGALIIDPCVENPHQYLQFKKSGVVIPKQNSLRGIVTIDVLDLNRENLISARSDSLRETTRLLEESLRTRGIGLQTDAIELRCKSDQQFAGMTRQFIQEWIQVAPTSLASESWKEIIEGLDIHEVTTSERDSSYYSCFISYSNSDLKFGERLRSDLDSNGIGYWFAPEHMKIGDRILSRIVDAIKNADRLLVIISKNSIRSKWVKLEIEEALNIEEKENKTVLFPICIDDDVFKEKLAQFGGIFKDRHIGDFRRWKNETVYQRSLQRLIRDLRQ